MKASKKFNYYVDGNELATIDEGEEVPEVAQKYASDNGYAEKQKPEHANKAKQPKRQTKAK